VIPTAILSPSWCDRQVLSRAATARRATLDAVVMRQAKIIAYIDDYKLLMIATLVLWKWALRRPSARSRVLERSANSPARKRRF